MFLALRDLRRSWRRFLLVGAVVALVALLSTTLTGLADGLVRDGISGLRALPFDHLALSPGSHAVFSRSTLDQAALDAWRRVPGAQVSPLGASFVNASSTTGGPSLDLALFGVPADSFLVQRPEARAALTGPPGLVLASELQDKGVRVGDTYRIRGSDVTLPVLGFTYAGAYGHVPIAFTTLSTWQSILYGAGSGRDEGIGRYSALALDLPDGVDVAAVDAVAGTETVTKDQAYAGSPGFSAETATMSLIRGFLLVISALIVGAFFTILTVQRTRQIGLLKAMGASNRQVLVDGVGQMTLVVVVATAIGAVAGALALAPANGSSAPVELTLPGVLTTSLLLVATGVVGALVPFRRITRVEPAIALGTEA